MATLAIDAGTTLIKAVLFDDDGTELAVAARPTTVHSPAPGWSEQDMVEVWESVHAACQEVLGKNPTVVSELAITAQGDGVWLIDKDGNPVRPAILWNDGRAASSLSHFLDDETLSEVFQTNGSFPSLGLPNAILMWLSTHEPETLSRASSVLTCGSWIFYKLTGVIGQHISEASAPWLDIHTGTISINLIERYGLSDYQHLIPPVLNGTELAQQLKPEWVTEWGLGPGVQCVLAPYDIVATATGSKASAPGDALVILGTTICPAVVVDAPQVDGAVTGLNLLGVGDGYYLRAFPTITGANTLSWLSSILKESDVASLMDRASESPPGSRSLLWLPYLSSAGERAPFFDPHARGVLYGLTDSHSSADISRALLESLCYVIREAFDASGAAVTSVAVSGGGAQSSLWCQTIADVTGVTVQRTSDSQVGAKGAQVYAAVASGRYASHSEAAEELVSPGDRFEPDVSLASMHTERYLTFRRLREAISPLWHEGSVND
jgi:xylulokinase